MASSFLRVTTSISVNQLAICKVLSKSSVKFNNACCHVARRNIVGIAVATECELRDALDHREIFYPKLNHLNPNVLKQKEKGDWRYLTMAEKKALYQLSANEFASDMPISNEWKRILAGTFFAMGAMTMGIYFYLTRNAVHQLWAGSIESTEDAVHRSKILTNFFLQDSVRVDSTFDSQPRH